MGVEINPFKALSLTSYTTLSSRVSSGPPDVAMCQSPAPSLFSFLLFFPFLSPNHMPWYSLITVSMLLFFFLGGGCLCTDCPVASFLPKCLYMASEMYFNLFPATTLDSLIWTCALPLSYSISLPYCPVTTIWLKNMLIAFLPCVND